MSFLPGSSDSDSIDYLYVATDSCTREHQGHQGHRPHDDDDEEEEDDEVEDNDKDDDNNMDENDDKGISGLGLDRDMGFS